MDKHFAALDHQDWKTVVVKTKQSKEEKKTTTKKLSEAQQKDIKLLKQVEEDPWEGFIKHFETGKEVPGVILHVLEKGIILQLENFFLLKLIEILYLHFLLHLLLKL